MSGSLDTAAEPRQVQMTVRSTAPTCSNGMLVMAQLEVPDLGLPRAYVLLDPMSNTLALATPCGCHVDLRLSDLITRLAAVKATRHEAGDCEPLH